MNETLWTPDGLHLVAEREMGTSPEDAEKVYLRVYQLEWKGRRRIFGVLGEASTSEAQWEDMAAAKYERELENIAVQVQQKSGKIRYKELDDSMKDEVAEALRAYKEFRDRKLANPFGKKYI